MFSDPIDSHVSPVSDHRSSIAITSGISTTQGMNKNQLIPLGTQDIFLGFKAKQDKVCNEQAEGVDLTTIRTGLR